MRTKNGWDEEVWVRISSVRALAKQLRRYGGVTYALAFDHVVRACGFSDFSDAIDNPRRVMVAFDGWVGRLNRAFSVDLERLLGRKRLLVSYYKVFTDVRPLSLEKARYQTRPGGARGMSATHWSPEDEFVPPQISHESSHERPHADAKTGRTPASWASDDEFIPSYVSHEQTVVDAIGRQFRGARRPPVDPTKVRYRSG